MIRYIGLASFTTINNCAKRRVQFGSEICVFPFSVETHIWCISTF